MTRVFVSAGEASGDMHAADFVRALRQQEPGVQVLGIGGPLMWDAGVDVLFDPTGVSSVGFVEALQSARVLRRVLQRAGDALDEEQPDAVVLIDFPGFNLKLAEMAHRRGIPCVYYLSPSVWAWGRGRAERMRRLGIHVCAVFPFEEAVLRETGVSVQFVGHPLLDRVRPDRTASEVRQQLGVGDGQCLIALMPGSREQELRELLPAMLQAARLLHEQHPNTRFVLPVSHTLSADRVDALLEKDTALPLTTVEGRTYDVLAAADLGIIGMGTATLEAALLGVPHVACYKVSGATYTVVRRMLRIQHVALPNIIAARRIVPELLQSDVTGTKLAEALAPMFDEKRRAQQRAELAGVRSALGETGAAKRVATAVLERVRRGERN